MLIEKIATTGGSASAEVWQARPEFATKVAKVWPSLASLQLRADTRGGEFDSEVSVTHPYKIGGR